MITFRGKKDGLETIGLIINNENLVRLVNGEPISISGSALRLGENSQIFIAYMERDEFIRLSEEAGALNDNTQLIYTGKRS